MAVIEELIREEENGSLSFGNYELASKTKQDGFVYNGDSYKIKTFNEITKLERNGMFVYESVPGTAVHGFMTNGEKVVMTTFSPFVMKPCTAVPGTDSYTNIPFLSSLVISLNVFIL